MLKNKLLASMASNTEITLPNKLSGIVEPHNVSTGCYSFDMSIDGLHLLVGAYSGMYSYTLTVPFDLKTATLDAGGPFTPSNYYNGSMHGVTWNNDGKYITVLYRNSADSYNYYITEFSLSVAWDISTASAILNINTGTGNNKMGCFWNNDGTVYYYTDTYDSSMKWYVCSTPYRLNSRGALNSIAGSTFLPSLSFASYGYYFSGYNSDGTKCFFQDVASSSGGNVVTYNLTTPYDVLTADDSSYQKLLMYNIAGTNGVSTIIHNNGIAFLNYSYVYSVGLKQWTFDSGVTLDDVINPLFYTNADIESPVIALSTGYNCSNGLDISDDENYIFSTVRYNNDRIPRVARINISSGITTATVDTLKNLSSSSYESYSIAISKDGLRLSCCSYYNPNAAEGLVYGLSTPNDINTATLYSGSNWTLTANLIPMALFFFNNGYKFVIKNTFLDKLYVFSTSSPYYINFSNNIQSVDFKENIRGILITDDGHEMYVTSTRGIILKYTMTTAFDFTTLVATGDAYFADYKIFIQPNPYDGYSFKSQTFSNNLKSSYVMSVNGSNFKLQKYIL